MTKEPTPPEILEERILGLLDTATGMQLGLSEEDSDYTLDFLKKKLAMCSYYTERLSDIMMELTKISLEATRISSSKNNLLSLKHNELKASSTYSEQPRDKKTSWLESQLGTYRGEAERWNMLRRVVSEVKDAVGERGQTMKRLDSDLRLHSKLLEMTPPGARGAAAPTGFQGSSSDELDIN